MDSPMANEFTVSSNLFYNAFSKTGLPPGFVWVIGIRWFIGFAGFCLNASLLWVTWRTKILRESCNLLLAANAIFAGLFGLSLSIGWALVLAGSPFLPLSICFLLQAIPLLCRNVGLNTLLFIGIDRLICVLRPGWKRNSFLYFLLIALLSLSHALFIVFSCLKMAIDMPNLQILCTTHDDVYQQGGMTILLFYMNVALSIVILCVYLALWAVVKAKNNAFAANSANTRKILRSLTALMTMLVAGFILNNTINVLYLWFSFSSAQKAYISVILACLPALAFASNAPLLIAFSSEYRKAYANVFCRQMDRRQSNNNINKQMMTIHQLPTTNLNKTIAGVPIRMLGTFGRRSTFPVATTTTISSPAGIKGSTKKTKGRTTSIVPY